jgi:ureidoglycolate lyase
MDNNVGIKELTLESFQIYGSFAKMLNPKGPKLEMGPIQFFPDMGFLNLGSTSTAAFSIVRAQKRENIINYVECHMYTGEGTLPLNGDVLVFVAPATPKDIIPLDKIEVFHVPKGTLITLRPGVWHGTPFAENSDVVHVLIILPERTYVNDAYFYNIPKEKEIRIVES